MSYKNFIDFHKAGDEALPKFKDPRKGVSTWSKLHILITQSGSVLPSSGSGHLFTPEEWMIIHNYLESIGFFYELGNENNKGNK